MADTPMIKSNLHTHTSFCDGKHTAEEVVLAAIDAKMELLGFSEHCCTGVEGVFGMKQERVPLYRDEIRRLQAAYGDRIGILLGVEQDYYAGAPVGEYDYVIGSVHYVYLGGEYCGVDYSAEHTLKTVNEHCGGDIFKYAKAYYDCVARVADVTRCNIVGHFDLLAKFNEDGRMIDESDKRYVTCALEALDALLEKDVIFEVNTGAISRGYRKTPYPSPFILKRIAEKKGRVMLNSDAHNKDHLLCAFDQALERVRTSGIPSVTVMTRDGWKEIKL